MNNNVSAHVPYENCCGCSACYNACPKAAITMQENVEGFLVPQVDAEKCIDCGLCLKACPALNEKRSNAADPECYAAQADDKIRAVSSSGGVFTPLAESIIDRGGVVCGAAFREDWTVHHIIVDNKADIAKLRGSKYVQSEIGDCFKRVKSLLREGKWVLFSGTPCQVAGLYTYLGKDYDTLLTVDIFCHGAPSPGVWKRYLRENYEPGTIANVNFRDKSAIGWSCSHVAITQKNGKKDVSNNYTKWFHGSVILRPSCANCKYNKLPRPSDISLGDWWGISKIDNSLNDGKGLSNVLINSPKGKSIYEQLSLPVSKRLQLPPDYGNGGLRHGHGKLHFERANFFANNMPLNTDKRSAIIESKKFDICYVAIFYGRNYGSMLVSYAGYKLLEKLGYEILVLNKPTFIWPHSIEIINDTIQHAFAWRQYKHISRQHRSLFDLAYTNDLCNAYVVGGDQMFKPYLNIDPLSYLQFARKDKLKIAFGTSFGENDYSCPSNDRIYRNKQLLQRFNHIALRETSDNLAKNFFEVEATEIIDLTLILPPEDFHELANQAQKLEVPDKYLLTYNLDMNPAKEAAIAYVANKLGLEIVYIQHLQRTEVTYRPSKFKAVRDYSPEEFCKLYQGATYVVTDSYHGSCFSIIFRKPFVSFVNKARGGFRYKMFDSFGLSHRFYATPEEIYKTDKWMEPVDYTQASKIIEAKAQYARRWLENSLRSLRPQKRKRKQQECRKTLSKAIAYPVRDFFRKLRKAIFRK